MAVVSMVVGAATDDGATFVAKVDGGGPVRVAVAEDSGMTLREALGEAVDAVLFHLAGLLSHAWHALTHRP